MNSDLYSLEDLPQEDFGQELSSAELPFALLKSIKSSPRTELIRIITNTAEVNFLEQVPRSESLYALDVETDGIDVCKGGRIVGLSLASNSTLVYYSIKDLTPNFLECLVSYLEANAFELIAHNAFFDSSFFTRDFPTAKLNWSHCTYALYKLLATEGFNQQEWGLKAAMVHLLGWPSSNESELDAWLIREGVVKNTGKPDKSRMSLAPAEILGKYCCLDSDATLQLFTQVLKPQLEHFQGLNKYYVSYFNPLIHDLVKQKLSGIPIDVPKLQAYSDSMTTSIVKAEQDFLRHPEVNPKIEEYNNNVLREKLLKEPAKLTKKGLVSKNWLKWEEQVQALKEVQHFNINSGKQRSWLFYEQLKKPILLRTDSGLPAVDKRALLAWGEPGQLLKKANDLEKESQYVSACLEHSALDSLIHPDFRVPGTLTGRLAGSGGLNLQQVPKTRGYLSCWIPREGMKWVDCDHSALEQVVLAELSRDAALLQLYGPDAKPNDVYLFTGAQLPGLGEAIRKSGYDPLNPTAESVAKAKKECKRERGISKVIVLGSSYGMGPGKLAMTLGLSGIPITLEQAKELHKKYWELYKGVKDYEAYLLKQFSKNKGWVLNGIGRPLGICEDYSKDIVNRVVQSTGHDLHVVYWSIVKAELLRRRIPYKEIIVDFHDQSIVEVQEKDAEEVKELMGKWAYSELNRLTPNLLIPLKGEANVVSNLAEAKIAE